MKEDGEEQAFLEQVAGFVAAQEHGEGDKDGGGDEEDDGVEVEPGEGLDAEPALMPQQPPDAGDGGGGDQEDP